MKIIHTRNEQFQLSQQYLARQETIALVPTMGNLHAGHLALVKAAQRENDRVIVSVFVNPTQFGPNEDFTSYPRTLESDCEQLANLGVDCVFAPSGNELYPNGLEQFTYVDVPSLSDDLCGASRPGFFRGVCTVVSKLFHIVQPHRAFFGEKDFQQLIIIRQMVQDLCFPSISLVYPSSALTLVWL